MKKIALILFFVVLTGITVYSQIPEKINYQAVIRNSTGKLVTDQNVGIKISVLDAASGGNVLYSETHTVLTNAYGQVALEIGNGTGASVDFSTINWSVGDKFLKLEVDIAGGTSYVPIGTSQMLSVPFALYADKASTAELLGTEGVYSTNTDTLFVVKDHSGNVVFAVFPDGAQVIVNEVAKGSVGGFAVSGRSPSKAVDVDILKVTIDSTRIYVNDTVTVKGSVGGFAVSGRSPSKNINTNLLFVTADSTRIYFNEEPTAKGKVGGFAISGRSPSKGITYDYFQVTKDSTRVYVTESVTKGSVGGFAVSGRSPSKGTSQHMFVTTTDSTRIFTRDTIGGFGILDNSGDESSSYMQLTPLNYFIGHESGQLVRQDPLNPGRGKYNTFFGYQAGKNTIYGYKNIFMGYKAGYGNTSGAWNIFIGNNAGASVTNALSNIFIGDEAGTNITDGINNIFIGKEAGRNSTTFVSQDVFIGHGAGRSNVSGGGNVFVGISSGYSSTGDENTFLGKHTGFSNTGSYNTYIGSESGIYTGVGTKNVYIGYRAGYRSYGTRNVFIGTNANNTKFVNVSYSNCVAIGDSVIVSGDNEIRIGNSNATSFYAQGIYSSTTSNAANLYMYSSGRIVRSTSSKRYKKDIVPLEINTSNIYKLNPVSFTSKSEGTRHFGLIAEEVAEVIPELAEFAREKDVIPGSESEELIPDAVQYPILSVLLLKEVQNHELTIQKQAEQIELLNDENKDLQQRLKKLEELLLK